MSSTIFHNHHKIPKHAGGTNDPDNIIRLTIEEHADAHKKLYEQYGKKEDYLAYKCLSGQIENAEINYWRGVISAQNRKLSKEHKQKISKSLIGNKRRKGILHTDETKQKMKDAHSKIEHHWYWEGKSHSTQTKDKMCINNSGAGNPNSRKINLYGIEYPTMKDACEALGITIYKLRKLIS